MAGCFSGEHGYTGQRDHSPPRRDRADGARFCHATQNSVPFKTYQLFISRIFHLLFSDHSWSQVTDTTESKTVDKG